MKGDREFIDLVLKVIDDEPELPGEPPSEFKSKVSELRSAVRTTKKSIRKRLIKELKKRGLMEEEG